jgi:hypothetical protein
MLARIDGKSPVEYLVDEAPRERVRRFARAQLSAPTHDTMALASAWFGAGA